MLKTNVFTPVVSATYDVTGIMNYDWGAFKIEPRDINDVVISASIAQNLLNNTKIYPIPANNNLTVNSEKEITSVELFNIVGAKIANYAVNANNTNINVNNIKAGVYFLKVNFAENSIMQKVIIK